jgi:hypothetical protein
MSWHPRLSRAFEGKVLALGQIQVAAPVLQKGATASLET